MPVILFNESDVDLARLEVARALTLIQALASFSHLTPMIPTGCRPCRVTWIACCWCTTLGSCSCLKRRANASASPEGCRWRNFDDGSKLPSRISNRRSGWHIYGWDLAGLAVRGELPVLPACLHGSIIGWPCSAHFRYAPTWIPAWPRPRLRRVHEVRRLTAKPFRRGHYSGRFDSSPRLLR